MTIGERIKQRRIELGLSQEELAKRLGNKSRASVCTVEKDKEDMTTDRVRKYAEALECTPAYLMGWDEGDNISPAIKIYKKVGSEKVEASAEDMERALDFYRKYKDAIPEIQAAVLALLKPDQQDS